MTGRRGVLLAGLAAAAAAGGLHAGGVLEALEQDTRVERFERRGPQPVRDVLLVTIDGQAASTLGLQWPFPRSEHAKAIDELTRLGARTIAYDVQFTEPTDEDEDLALFDAARRSGRLVLATTEVDDRGGHAVMGGPANVREMRAVVGMANLEAGRDARIEQLPPETAGLPSFALAAAARAGRPLRADAPLWIDFPGPPGTVPSVGFDELRRGRVPASLVRGRVVVVGVTAATEQDLHLTSASAGRLMPGAELQAAAIHTALRGAPLREAPWWAGLAAVLAAALLPVLAGLRRGAAAAVLAGLAAAAAAVAAAVVLFERAGLLVPLAGPVAGALLGTGAAVGAGWATERLARRRAEQREELLDGLVRDRTSELRDTQLELAQRLARTAEWRDEDTGAHIDRMSRMCQRLALAAGWSAARAEDLRHASALHDIGKIAIPDAVLLKPGRLTEDEYAHMREHARIGADMLAGSASPLLQLAEVVAATHHERWDGAGYPARLAGEAIPLPGRIAAICDVFDALCSERPYKRAWPVAEALAEIERCAGTQFDPVLVELFLPLARRLEADRAAADAAHVPRPDRAAAGVRA